MKKKKATKAKAKTARKRSAVRDLSARKAGAVKGGLLPAVKQSTSSTSLKTLDSPTVSSSLNFTRS